MSPVIPDGAILPNAYSLTEVVSSGVSVSSGVRIPCIVGTGQKSEVIVSSAVGNGNDGLNSSYTSTTGKDGRHFTTRTFPLVSNRTQLFKNGVPLVGLEEVPGSDAFSNRYDYRIDIATGSLSFRSWWKTLFYRKHKCRSW